MSRRGESRGQTRSEGGKKDAYAAIRWARRQRIKNVVAKNLLITLATYADPDGTGAWPSQEELAADTSYSVRAIRRALAELAGAGYLQRRERQRKNGSRSTDEYRLNLAWPAEFPDDDWPDVPVASTRETGTTGRAKRTLTTDRLAPESGPTTFDQPDYLPKEDSSEPFGSGPAEREPGQKQVFSEGRETLIGLGVSRKTAGDVIHRWLRETGGDAPRVLGAIRLAANREAQSPIPYVAACLRPRAEHGRPAAQAGEPRRRTFRNPYLQLLIEHSEGRHDDAPVHHPFGYAASGALPALAFARL